MPILESQLETWSKQGPSGQFTATYETLRGVLNHSNSPYYRRDFTIFLQSSYKNDTNVYGDSDVDVVIRLDETFALPMEHERNSIRFLISASGSKMGGHTELMNDLALFIRHFCVDVLRM